MHRLDLTLPFPAENLALDEVMLDRAETGQVGESLLFWEAREVFVVIGYANKVATEVNVPACETRKVPIFRRCSGGGTVVQIPGGLNYSLILAIHEDGPTRNITAANQYIMGKNRAAIEQALRASSPSSLIPAVTVRGHTDLCLGDVKFAGNSQRRRKNFLLFHGTILLDCDLSLIGDLLLMPSLQPDYRANRSHRDFVTNLNLPAEAVKNALTQEWGAHDQNTNPPLAEISRLAREKYSSREWNFKF